MTEAEKYAADMLTMIELEISQHCLHSSREAHIAAGKAVLKLQVKAIMTEREGIVIGYDLVARHTFWKDVLKAIDKLK